MFGYALRDPTTEMFSSGFSEQLQIQDKIELTHAESEAVSPNTLDADDGFRQ